MQFQTLSKATYGENRSSWRYYLHIFFIQQVDWIDTSTIHLCVMSTWPSMWPFKLVNFSLIAWLTGWSHGPDSQIQSGRRVQQADLTAGPMAWLAGPTGRPDGWSDGRVRWPDGRVRWPNGRVRWPDSQIRSGRWVQPAGLTGGSYWPAWRAGPVAWRAKWQNNFNPAHNGVETQDLHPHRSPITTKPERSLWSKPTLQPFNWSISLIGPGRLQIRLWPPWDEGPRWCFFPCCFFYFF
jgi:hypothetical protein